MSIQTAVYQKLATDEALQALLAVSTINPDKPAIYEIWAPQDTPMPYINLSYSTSEANHWAKRNTAFYVDIFSDQDSTQAEAIKNRVLKILDRQRIQLENDHKARVYSDRDGMVTEPAPGVVHWEMTFSLIYWRKTFIEHLS